MSKALKAALLTTPQPEQAPLLADYLDKHELAREFKVTPRTIDRWHVMRTGPKRVLLGQRVLYRRADVIAWLAEQDEKLVGRPRRRKHNNG